MTAQYNIGDYISNNGISLANFDQHFRQHQLQYLHYPLQAMQVHKL